MKTAIEDLRERVEHLEKKGVRRHTVLDVLRSVEFALVMVILNSFAVWNTCS